ncbi:hypothetical protein ABZP36_008922 [Zizania latifolia]
MVDPLEVCSVVIGETIQQIVSFIQNYRNQQHVDKIHRLWQLLINRIHTTLEEAKGCAIMNSRLLRCLREIEDTAYQGGQALCNWRDMSNKVSSTSTLVNPSNTFKRIKVATASAQLLPCKEATIKIAGTVEKLEGVTAGIPRFIQSGWSVTKECWLSQ